MALSTATIWEIRPTNGVDTYGGGFSPGTGTTTVNAATDLTIDATSNVKVTAGHSFVSGDVMKFINVTAGTDGLLVGIKLYLLLVVQAKGSRNSKANRRGSPNHSAVGKTAQGWIPWRWNELLNYCGCNSRIRTFFQRT